MIITIDGPVASGKSSVAKKLAEELKMYYLYTGLLYRAVAHIMFNKLFQERNKEISIDELSSHLKTMSLDQLGFVKNICYDYGKNEGEARPYIFYQDEEITEKLYTSELDQPASIVSANRYVREALLSVQRDIAKKYDIIADGRDCGTVVFPDADHKFYLTADVDVRAQRLMLDETRGALEKDFAKVKVELEERDKRDQERLVAPLKIPQGAIIVDNSKLTLEDTVNKFLLYIST
jgi:cytidylate kinase